MNQDQYFVDLFTTVSGSLKQNYVRCLALLKFLGLGDKCWKRCALCEFHRSCLVAAFRCLEYFNCDTFFYRLSPFSEFFLQNILGSFAD